MQNTMSRWVMNCGPSLSVDIDRRSLAEDFFAAGLELALALALPEGFGLSLPGTFLLRLAVLLERDLDFAAFFALDDFALAFALVFALAFAAFERAFSSAFFALCFTACFCLVAR